MLSTDLDNLASWLEARLANALPLPLGCTVVPIALGGLASLADRIRVAARDAREIEATIIAMDMGDRRREPEPLPPNVVPLRRVDRS